MNFDIFCKITVCSDKTDVTFAYDIGSKSFLYEKACTRNVLWRLGLGRHARTAPWAQDGHTCKLVGPEPPEVAGQLCYHGAFDPGVILTSMAPSRGRYAEGLFCEIILS
jgi:hypothetical protein